MSKPIKQTDTVYFEIDNTGDLGDGIFAWFVTKEYWDKYHYIDDGSRCPDWLNDWVDAMEGCAEWVGGPDDIEKAKENLRSYGWIELDVVSGQHLYHG